MLFANTIETKTIHAKRNSTCTRAMPACSYGFDGNNWPKMVNTLLPIDIVPGKANGVCRKTIYRTRKTFRFAKKSVDFSSSRNFFARNLRNITTLFESSCTNENNKLLYEIKEDNSLSSSSAAAARTKWRNFLTLHECLCVCVRNAMLSFLLLSGICWRNHAIQMGIEIAGAPISQMLLFQHFFYFSLANISYVLLFSFLWFYIDFRNWMKTFLMSLHGKAHWLWLSSVVVPVDGSEIFGARDTIVKSNANKLARTWLLCLCYALVMAFARDNNNNNHHHHQPCRGSCSKWHNRITTNDVKTEWEKWQRSK